MDHPDDARFEAYAAKLPAYLNGVSETLDATEFVHFARFVIRLLFVLEKERIELPSNEAGTTTAAFTMQAANELVAFGACMRAGAMRAAWHHTRALIEIRAAFKFVFGSPIATATRLAMWKEYDDANAYCTRRRLEIERDAGRLTTDEYLRRNLVSDARLAGVNAARIVRWKELFGHDLSLKPHKLSKWHATQISSMVSALGGGLDTTYEHACHATHISPLGHRLMNPAGPTMLGGNPTNTRRLTGITTAIAMEFIKQVDVVVGGTLRPHFDKEHRAFFARAKDMLPRNLRTETGG